MGLRLVGPPTTHSSRGRHAASQSNGGSGRRQSEPDAALGRGAPAHHGLHDAGPLRDAPGGAYQTGAAAGGGGVAQLGVVVWGGGGGGGGGRGGGWGCSCAARGGGGRPP